MQNKTAATEASETETKLKERIAALEDEVRLLKSAAEPERERETVKDKLLHDRLAQAETKNRELKVQVKAMTPMQLHLVSQLMELTSRNEKSQEAYQALVDKHCLLTKELQAYKNFSGEMVRYHQEASEDLSRKFNQMEENFKMQTPAAEHTTPFTSSITDGPPIDLEQATALPNLSTPSLTEQNSTASSPLNQPVQYISSNNVLSQSTPKAPETLPTATPSFSTSTSPAPFGTLSGTPTIHPNTLGSRSGGLFSSGKGELDGAPSAVKVSSPILPLFSKLPSSLFGDPEKTFQTDHPLGSSGVFFISTPGNCNGEEQSFEEARLKRYNAYGKDYAWLVTSAFGPYKALDSGFKR